MAQSLEQLYKQLESVQTAIAKTEKVQEYTVSSRSARHADLNTLYKREQDLIRRIDRMESGGIRVWSITPCP